MPSFVKHVTIRQRWFTVAEWLHTNFETKQ